MSTQPPGDGNAALPPHLDPRGRHRGRRTGQRTRSWSGVTRTALSLGALLSVSLLVLSGYTFYTYRGINKGVNRVEITGLGQTPVANKTGPTYHYNGQDQNLLLVGTDDRSNMTPTELRELHVSADGGTLSTDTMMVLHLPADGKKATLISFPRDSWVYIKGYRMDKLNSAYSYGYRFTKGTVKQKRTAGINLLTSTISDLSGLTINHYVQVNLLGFYEISNALGGIPVNLCKSVDDSYTANRLAGHPGGSGFQMSKGRHILIGKTALQFVRQRHGLPNGDLDREKRQQYFLTAAFRKVASVGILTKLNAVGNAVKRSVILDNSLNLLDLARQMENLSANNITGKTIPNYGATVNGLDVQIVNKQTVQRFVNDAINPPAKTASPSLSKAASKAPSKASSSAPKPIDAKCIN